MNGLNKYGSVQKLLALTKYYNEPSSFIKDGEFNKETIITF